MPHGSYQRQCVTSRGRLDRCMLNVLGLGACSHAVCYFTSMLYGTHRLYNQHLIMVDLRSSGLPCSATAALRIC